MSKENFESNIRRRMDTIQWACESLNILNKHKDFLEKTTIDWQAWLKEITFYDVSDEGKEEIIQYFNPLNSTISFDFAVDKVRFPLENEIMVIIQLQPKNNPPTSA